MARRARVSLTLIEYSDRELLNLMIDEGDGEGWVDSRDMARAIGLHKDHAGSVGCRMGWLRRYGAVERKGRTRDWRPTPVGRAMALGVMNEGLESELESLPPEQLLAVTRLMTRRFQQVGATPAHLIRREWRYGTYGRKF